MKLDIVPMTAAHVAQVWDEPAPVTFRGLAVVDGDRALGVTGIYADNARFVLVAKIAPEGREMLESGRHVKTLMVAARRVLALASQWRMPVHAVPEPGIPGSENLLKHLGFTPFYKETWAWPGSQ